MRRRSHFAIVLGALALVVAPLTAGAVDVGPVTVEADQCAANTVAVSGTECATGLVAASGTGDASGTAALSGTGDAFGLVVFSATGSCNGFCYDVDPAGDANASTIALAGPGCANAVIASPSARSGARSPSSGSR